MTTRNRGKWWHKAKTKVRARDGDKCRICGSRKYLQVSHIRGMHHYPELAKVLSNLLTLCGPCDGRYGNRLEEVREKWQYKPIVKTQ